MAPVTFRMANAKVMLKNKLLLSCYGVPDEQELEDSRIIKNSKLTTAHHHIVQTHFRELVQVRDCQAKANEEEEKTDCKMRVFDEERRPHNEQGSVEGDRMRDKRRAGSCRLRHDA